MYNQTYSMQTDQVSKKSTAKNQIFNLSQTKGGMICIDSTLAICFLLRILLSVLSWTEYSTEI